MFTVGHEFAPWQLAHRLAKRGDVDAAVAVLRTAVEAGCSHGMHRLQRLVYARQSRMVLS
jgi:pentatricopeptide repeat protein